MGLLLVLAVESVALSRAQASLWPEVSALLSERCIGCHSGEFAPLGLSLDSHASLLAGSENGPVVVPGDISNSVLARRIRGEAQPQMPLDGPPFLTPEEIALIETWIGAGAPGDGAAKVNTAPPADDGVVTFSDIEHILKQRCIVCHSDNSQFDAPPEGLRLTSLDLVLRGRERIVVIPGNPKASELWRRVTGLAEPRMPFNGPPWLTDAEIGLIRTWIEEGAVDDTGTAAPIPVGGEARLRGRMTGENEIDGAGFIVTGGTRVEHRPAIGAEAEMRGVVSGNGSITATRLRER